MSNKEAELDSSFLTSQLLGTDVAFQEANSIIDTACAAHTLWGTSNVGLYHTIQQYPTVLCRSGDSLEHLCCNYFTAKQDDLTENVLHYCQDKFCHIDVALQVVVEKDQPSPSNPHVLLPEDLIYDAERIAELNSSDGLEYKQEFLKAIIKEFSDLCKNDCFSLEVIPEERSPLSTRIVLKVKRKGDGSFDKFKARCVVRGFLAKIGLDFYATYSPSSSLTTSRTLMALAVHHNLPIHHSDIAQAFIQTKLDRPIFISFPKGVDIRSDLLESIQDKFPDSKLGIRLLRSLYGLKQAPMLWNKLLNSVLLEAGFIRSKNDTSLYIHHHEGKWVACAVFVDDILVTGTDVSKIAELRKLFQEKFKGEHQWDENINSFLGMDISYIDGVLSMNVKAKIDDLFKKYPFLASSNRWSQSTSSSEIDNPPSLDDDELSDYQLQLKENFASIVGSCIYFSITCRPDLSTIVSKACKGMHGPKKIHILYLQAMIQYLKEHRDLSLVYRKNSKAISHIGSLAAAFPEMNDVPSSPVVGFSDADWLPKASDGEQMKSTSGHCFYVFGSLVQWNSKRQTITAASTMQAELIAASSAADSAVWYHTLQCDFPFLFGLSQDIPAIPIMIDNKAALSVANHPESSPRTRHICLREFRIRDMHEAKQVRPYWCPGTHNVADVFTKLVHKTLFHRYLDVMGMEGSNRLHSDYPSLQGTHRSFMSEGLLSEWVVSHNSHIDEDIIFELRKSLDFESPQAVYAWDYWNASSGQLPDNYCKSFVSLHSTSFLNPQEYNLCGDGPVNTNVLEHHGSDNSSPSSRAKLNVAKLLYKQGMAKRATRLVQDHHRRGLSPPVPSCQTMVDVDPSFATPNAPFADWSRLSRVVELLACGAILYHVLYA